MKPRHRQVPPEYVALGKQCVEARERFEDLMETYRAMTILLSDSIYLQALSDNSPFSYQTLRSWIIAKAESDKPEVIEYEQPTLPFG